ncbi:MAG: AAA family ATPase, partial [Nocardioides sp.]|nr:AAA family ATPase [Nocardioides sp.]
FIAGMGDDLLSLTAPGLNVVAICFGWVGGRTLLAPPDWGYPDGTPAVVPATPRPAYAPPATAAAAYATGAPSDDDPPKVSLARPPAKTAGSSRVRPPGQLPTFRDVGGMDKLKTELQDTLGLLLAFSSEAERYRIDFNGILLHGRPGVGKTFIAKAAAGEFGMSFLPVASGDLISKYVGESAKNVEEVFAEAARNVPCLLFFDEFDSIAERRDDGVSEESKRVVNQLLQSLEKWRRTGDLVVMAATNHLDRLDPAVIRPGRFDRHVRVDLPDRAARIAILRAQLAGRPTGPDIDFDDLAERTSGRTPASIGKIVNAAALKAFQEAAETGAAVEISQQLIKDAIAGLGGEDRPVVEDWSWDKLVLSPATKAELQQIETLVKDPDLARRYGAEPPSGLLLTGPPGTGKTTIARVFAAQAGYSFYPQTASDLVSKWYGESEAQVTRLFARARDNAPAIIFIDEIDSIAARREETGSYDDRILNQLLAEIDGMTSSRGVFVMAATNRPDILDPALLRGGRLSRRLEIPLPSRAERLAL